jgi:general secretion pathway protein N
MTPGRAVSLLTGVALLGAIAAFNEMTPEAQASLLGAARTTAQSWFANAVATYNGMTAAQETPARGTPAPAAARAGDARDGRDAPPARTAVRTETTGNPLWALPLRQLSNTRERPIFSPSRRPPAPPTIVAPVAAIRQAPPPPAPPERPEVTLLGTIIGSKADDQIALFVDTATQSVIRLRVGQDHHGWVLRLIKEREATLQKAQQVEVLQLSAPGEGQVTPGFTGGLPGVPPGGLPPGVVPNAGMPPPGVPNVGPGVNLQQQRNRRQH